MSVRLSVARAVVGIASRLVPSGRRAEWRNEWEGELSASWHRRPDWRTVGFALGAIPHALAEFRQDWNADVLSREVRHAVRSLLRNPAYSLTATLLIAVGVGANTTVFTLVNAVLLRAPRGVEAPQQLVQIGRVGKTVESDPRDFDNWSYPLFVDFRIQSRSFSDLAAYVTLYDGVIGDDTDAQSAIVQLVSPSYFHLLGAAPARGRGFTDEDNAPGAAPVAIISDGLWRERFGLDPEIVGRTIAIRGTPFRIVGVTSREFTGADIGGPRPAIWAPLGASSIVDPRGMNQLDSRGTSWLWIVGRLRPGETIDAARAELGALHRSIQLGLDGKVREGVVLVRGLGLRPEDRALAATISTALFAMVALVLLVACANLAALLLARGAAREAEIGVRLALGGARGRVVRQLLIETSLVAIAGSVTAFVLTRWTARFIEWIMPYPLAVSFQPDVRVLVFALVVGVTTSAAFGVAPALRSTRVDLLSLLRAGAVGTAADRGRLRRALLVTQVAFSFILLGAAGVMTRSVQRANTADPGFRTDHIWIGELDVRATDSTPADALVRQLEQAAARAAATPGVLGATLASGVPASGNMGNRSMWRGDAVGPGARPPIVEELVVDTAYFHTMDIPILRGRAFDAAIERPGAPTAVVVNEALARRLWPGEDAVGRTVAFGTMAGPVTASVVGVARDTRNRSLRAPASPQAYFLLSQNAAPRTLLHVRLSPGAEPVLATLSRELRAVAPGSPPVRFQPARAWLALGYADVRLIGILGAAFGALALALASAGIHGVVSYETARRRREYGVRLALGASARQVHSMVLGQSARLSAVGIAIGIGGFALVAPLLERFVFGVSTFDATTLATITVVLLGSATVAALGPALRAARSDPMSSLRAD